MGKDHKENGRKTGWKEPRMGGGWFDSFKRVKPTDTMGDPAPKAAVICVYAYFDTLLFQ
jgi:hypothetical protein